MKYEKLDITTYNMVHQRMRRWYTKSGMCEFCEAVKKTHWANKDGKYDSFDPDNWYELCAKCHANYDWSRKLKKHQKCEQCHETEWVLKRNVYTEASRWPRKAKFCLDCYTENFSKPANAIYADKEMFELLNAQ